VNKEVRRATNERIRKKRGATNRRGTSPPQEGDGLKGFMLAPKRDLKIRPGKRRVLSAEGGIQKGGKKKKNGLKLG